VLAADGEFVGEGSVGVGSGLEVRTEHLILLVVRELSWLTFVEAT